MPAKRLSRRTLLALVATLVIWSAVSYAFVSMTAGSGVCKILQPIVKGETPHPLTQAEMDAQTARCNRPNLGILTFTVVGYVLIVGFFAARPARDATRGSE